MRSSLYLRRGAPLEDEDSNYYPLGVLADGRVAVHAAPTVPPLDNMAIAVDGAASAWDWTDLPTLAPDLAVEIATLPGYPHTWME